MPGYRVENIALENISIHHPGGVEASSNPGPVRELPKSYPESIMYGPLPAYGFYCRHVNGLLLSNIRLQLAKPDERSAVICDDVEDFTLNALSATNTGSMPLISLHNSQNALVQGSRPKCELLLTVDGPLSTDVALLSNDLRAVRTVAAKGSGFAGKIVEAGSLHAT